MSYEEYTSLDTWDLAVRAAILSSVGVRFDDIVDLQVVDMPIYYTNTGPYETIGLVYTVTLAEDRHVSYGDLESYLDGHIMYFDGELLRCAVSQDIQLLSFTIFTLSVQAEDPAHPSISHHNTNIFSAGVLAGMSIASCAVLICLCYAVPYVCKKVCFGYVLPHLERLEERDLELQSVHPQRDRFDMYAAFNPAPRRPLRSVRPVPTLAVTVTPVPRADYLPVVVAEVQVVGAADDEK